MGERLTITGGTLVLPNGEKQSDVVVEDGAIVGIVPAGEGAEGRGTIVDARGAWVLPGLIDVHCDAIEKEVEPRPNTLFPMDMAFLNFERKLAGHGITTMLHSLSLGVGLSLRGEHLVSRMIELIVSFRNEAPLIRHGVHLRYEVSHLTGFALAERCIEEGLIDYLSLMDHAPGIGQYHRPGAFERYVMKNQGVSADEVKAIVDELQGRRALVDWDRLRALTGAARSRGIAVASHDDDTAAAVDHSRSFGATVSEFPLNLATTEYATARGMDVCVGAPNIVRGGSHDGNLKAVDAVKGGSANMLCSDYHPASLLHAIFALEAEGVPLADAVAMATLAPARMLGRDGELGSIEAGKRADLIVVRKTRGVPLVTDTLVNGTVVHRTRPYF